MLETELFKKGASFRARSSNSPLPLLLPFNEIPERAVADLEIDYSDTQNKLKKVIPLLLMR